MKYLIIVLLLVAVISSSCNKKFVRDNPREQYRQCLRDNADNTEKCEMYRDSYQERIDSHKDAYHQGAGSGDY